MPRLHPGRPHLTEARTTDRQFHTWAVPNRPHTLRRNARTDDAFQLSVRGANAMAGARPHRAEPGATTRPTKGGAVRIRIALSTAIAVLVIPSLVIPSLLFMSFSSTGAGAARAHHGRHEAGTRHRAAKTESKPASHSRAHEAAQAQLAKAQKAAELASYYEAVNKANFYNAVTKQQEETYLKEYAYLKGLAYLRASAYLKALAAQQAAVAAQQAKAQQAAAAAAAVCSPCSPCRPGRSAPGRRRLGRHEHEHARLGLYPGARVQRQLRRGWRRGLPVRTRHVGGAHRPEHAGGGLSARRPRRRGAQALRRARLGALDHTLRVRAVTDRS